MVSEMAKEDFYALERQGVKVSFENLVRLNHLGLKAESSADSFTFFTVPRCVFLKIDGKDDIVLREPTIAHEIWFDSVQRSFDLDDNFTLIALRIFTLSKEADELPKWYHISQVNEAVAKFVKKDLKDFTIRQLMNAMRYCLEGIEFSEQIEEEDDKGEETRKPEGTSLEIGIMREAQAIGLGITMEEMGKMTTSELQKLILMKYSENKIDVGKRIKDDAIMNYYNLLEKIKREGKENG